MKALATGLFGLAMVGSACAVSAQPPAGEQAGDTDRVIPAEQLSALVAKLVDGRASATVLTGPHHRVLTVVRAARGEVERHENMADLFIVQHGVADVLLGGRIDGGREIGPGERLGGTIVGGHLRRIKPGDLLWVPAGMPHQVARLAEAPLRYLVVKIARAEERGGSDR